MTHWLITISLAVWSLYLLHQHFRATFKIAYYETRMRIHGHTDTVKDMPWWQIWKEHHES